MKNSRGSQIKEFSILQGKAIWRCSLITRTKCWSWRASKAPTIDLTTLIAMRSGETIKPFYKVTWHKNAGRTEKKEVISRNKDWNLFSFALFLYCVCVFEHVCVCVCVHVCVHMCVFLCLFEAAWLAWMGGLVSRSLSAITPVHLHTLWASVGMKRGLWLWLILEGHTLNTTVNNRAIKAFHTKLKCRGENWGDTIWVHTEA